MDAFELKKILVATDLTPASEPAIAFAADLVETVGAEAILFNAISPIGFVDYGSFDDDTMARAMNDLSRRTEAKLQEMTTDYFSPNVKVVARAASGYPISSICNTADEENADLIIMGTHGRNPFMSFLIGSVVQGVQFRTTRPVITVPQRKHPLESQEIMTILCPVNLTTVALEALMHAGTLGSLLGAEVVALHLLEAEEVADIGDISRRLHQWVPESLRRLCDLRVLVRRGNAAEEVIAYAEKQRVDLIVIGAQHKRFANTTVLGTTTERVTRHAPCPVMSVMVPKEADRDSDRKGTEEPAGVSTG